MKKAFAKVVNNSLTNRK